LVESGTTTRSGVFINTGNTIVNGTLTANGNLRLEGSIISDSGTVIDSNGKINANNAIENSSITESMLNFSPIGNTEARLLINDRMQVANTLLLVNDRVQVANVSVYLEVANAEATYVRSSNAFVDNITVSDFMVANNVGISSPKGLVFAGGGLGDQVPATSNASVEGITQGTMWYSNNYLYIAVDGSTIKRVELSEF
jgi:hypothetical protein